MLPATLRYPPSDRGDAREVFELEEGVLEVRAAVPERQRDVLVPTRAVSTNNRVSY